MIAPGATFSYEVTIPIGGRTVAARARTLEAAPRSRVATALTDRLVGYQPEVWILEDRVLLVATGRDHASYRAAALTLNGDVAFLIRAHDVVHLLRTPTGRFGFALIRDGAIVVAAGALSRMPALSDVGVTCSVANPDVALIADGIRPEDAVDCPLQIAVADLSHTFVSPGKIHMGPYLIECLALGQRGDGFGGRDVDGQIAISYAADLEAVVAAGPEPLLTDLQLVSW